jgi:hypothetical protein
VLRTRSSAMFFGGRCWKAVLSVVPAVRAVFLVLWTHEFYAGASNSLVRCFWGFSSNLVGGHEGLLARFKGGWDGD